MRNPADLAHPKPGEMPTEQQLSEDDRLKLRAIISQAEAEKAAVERIKLEQGTPRTQAELLKYGRSLDLEPYEVGNALKMQGLAPFNAENWEKMKEVLRSYAESKPIAAD
jgi:hypothetical protein